ncbi:hypothetical protein D1BOALGB6SA_1391 [Olavius sp. associated proteobacterium Delta 1]|nr:hypothetical protein D1BOALGB6SA_1391 [Olavius sp. associated proteobacterium Delta 1]
MIGWLDLDEAVHQMPTKQVTSLVWILRADISHLAIPELEVYPVHALPHDLITSENSAGKDNVMSVLVWRSSC